MTSVTAPTRLRLHNNHMLSDIILRKMASRMSCLYATPSYHTYVILLKVRLHFTAGCTVGCTTGCTTGWTKRLKYSYNK